MWCRQRGGDQCRCRYDEAAELLETALPDAASGTALLRVATRGAVINAARNRPDEVTRALGLAETAFTERTPDEPTRRARLRYRLGGQDRR